MCFPIIQGTFGCNPVNPWPVDTKAGEGAVGIKPGVVRHRRRVFCLRHGGDFVAGKYPGSVVAE